MLVNLTEAHKPEDMMVTLSARNMCLFASLVWQISQTEILFYSHHHHHHHHKYLLSSSLHQALAKNIACII